MRTPQASSCHLLGAAGEVSAATPLQLGGVVVDQRPRRAWLSGSHNHTRAVPSSPQVVKTGRPFTRPSSPAVRLSHHVVSGQTCRGIRPSAEGRSARGAGFAISQNAYPWPVTATRRKWPLPGDPDVSIGARHHRLPRFYLERSAGWG